MIDRRRVMTTLAGSVVAVLDGLDLRLFSTIMTLCTPQDITLQGLRVETFFPADRASEVTWMRSIEAR